MLKAYIVCIYSHMMKELLNSVADKYIVSNISMFGGNNKIYLYGADGTNKELGRLLSIMQQSKLLIIVQIMMLNLFKFMATVYSLAQQQSKLQKEVNKQSLNFNKALKVKVTVG